MEAIVPSIQSPRLTTCQECSHSIPSEMILQRLLETSIDKKITTKKVNKQNVTMKRFIPTAALLLWLCFFAACNSSKNPEANMASPSPAASAATITASPNPVPTGGGPGNTTITWNTAGGTDGQVYVSVDGGPESIFTAGPSGSTPAPWIQAGKTYEFRLYAGTEHATVLAKTQVTSQK